MFGKIDVAKLKLWEIGFDSQTLRLRLRKTIAFAAAI